MPFVLLVVFCFLLGMIFDRRPNRQIYALVAVVAAGATVYFLR